MKDFITANGFQIAFDTIKVAVPEVVKQAFGT